MKLVSAQRSSLCRVIFSLIVGAFVLNGLLAPIEVQARLTAKQKASMRKIDADLAKAGKLYTQQKYEACAKTIEQIQTDFEVLSADADAELVRLLGKHYDRLQKARGLLLIEGIGLPPLKELKVKDPTTDPMPDAASGFVANVAPILVSKCGRCHIDRASGGFNMSTYPLLMKGSTEGIAVFAKDSKGSRLIESIEEGEMPRGGGSVSEEELAALKTWIDAGAKFDGEDEQAPLKSLVPETEQPQRPTAEVVQATGKETIHFGLDIAPILVKNCNGCHYNAANNAQGNFRMDSFRQLLRGGDQGAPIVAGKPEESLLVKLIKAKDNSRMPRRRPALTEEEIAKIETWVKEGATFDAPDANQDLGRIADIAVASAATHEELMVTRNERAQKNWRLGMPSAQANRAESDNFLFMGKVDTETLEDLKERSEKLVPLIARQLNADARGPMIKGRMTFYVFSQRYNYGEFGKMVEQRSLPQEWQGHWKYDVLDAYAALVLPRVSEDDKQDPIDSILIQNISGTYVSGLGQYTPQWFAEGMARWVVTQIRKKDPRIEQWRDSFNGIVSSMESPADFIRGRMGQEQAGIMSYGFVFYLMKDQRRFGQLLSVLKRGQDFPAAFKGIYGDTPEKLAGRWLGGGKR